MSRIRFSRADFPEDRVRTKASQRQHEYRCLKEWAPGEGKKQLVVRFGEERGRGRASEREREREIRARASNIADAACFLLLLHDAFEKERVARQVVPGH